MKFLYSAQNAFGGPMTLRTKILAIAATLCATAFYAGCDDSSSSPAAPTPAEGEVSSSSVQAQEPQPASSEPAETAEPESSSSVAAEPSAESSSSAEETVTPAEECYDGGASITLRSVERINFSCPNAMTMYNYDTWTYTECVGSRLVETEMPPCSM